AFFDDDMKKAGKQLEGVRIFSTNEMENWLSKETVEELFISIPDLSNARKSELAEIAVQHKLKLKHVPHARNWINGSLSANQIRTVKYEDLLGREEIQINSPRVSAFVKGKRILVTGAAGSIGSEIVRQLLKLNPQLVVALDSAESPMFQLGRELESNPVDVKFEMVIGDVRNESRMRKVFEAFNLDVVFHAAAYKHVPLMEDNPSEAIITNVFGTEVVLNLAIEHQVSHFLLVSTDKAVNPTNIMGASKRIAELLVQANAGSIKKVVTRFGNVLGSNGSVIPVFRRQIEQGGPVTVTHEKIERFFMTIPEAVQLVLEASTTDGDNEIVVFDMGKQIKIADLARNMIVLSGLEPDVDIQIHYTGLRPGEKLFEEVLSAEENLKATHHPKILKASPRQINSIELNESLVRLKEAALSQENMVMVKIMKDIVPEFVSNNSEFSSLDT
ncbi:MAG: polysaccharide biosynthesis protein, partial [Bacteroidota bacterium]